jgi:hypothetical protein
MGLSYEQLLISNELSEIIRHHNQCLDRLRAYRDSYPFLIAPNVAAMLEENLKENVQLLYREFNNLHKPKAEQVRHVCQVCNSVFAARLPGGVCDECRSRVGAPQPQFGARPRVAVEIPQPERDQTPETAAEEPVEQESAPDPTAEASAVMETIPEQGIDAGGDSEPAPEAGESQAAGEPVGLEDTPAEVIDAPVDAKGASGVRRDAPAHRPRSRNRGSHAP